MKTLIKFLVAIVLILSLSSCVAMLEQRQTVVRQKNAEYIERSWPQAPYPNPDKVDKFIGEYNNTGNAFTSGQYLSITYIYNCYQGVYVAVTYDNHFFPMSKWETNYYESTCIK